MERDALWGLQTAFTPGGLSSGDMLLRDKATEQGENKTQMNADFES